MVMIHCWIILNILLVYFLPLTLFQLFQEVAADFMNKYKQVTDVYSERDTAVGV